MGKLENKIAVITGGNSGIGLSAAHRFISEGAKVVIFGRNRETLDKAVSDLGENAAGVQGDVANLKDLERLYETVARKHGKIDVLFANAGIFEIRPSDQVDEAHYDRLFNINVKGAFYTIQKAYDHLNDGASIIINSSVVSNKGFAGMSVYSATKAAVRSLARTLASELAPRAIRVNAISPGLTETPIIERAGIVDEAKLDFEAQTAKNTPLGRVGQPEEVANVVAFLASSEAAFITGVDYAIDGGLIQV